MNGVIYVFIFLVRQRRGTDGGDIYSSGTKILLPEEIYSTVTNVVTPDIYGTSSTPLEEDIYGNAPPKVEIYGTEEPRGPGGDIDAVQKSNTIIPPIVQTPSSMLLPVIPIEATLSSVFIKLSSTTLNDPANTRKNPSPTPSSPRSSPVPPKSKSPKGKGKKNNKSPKLFQSSKFIPTMRKQKIQPVVQMNTAASKSNTTGSDVTSGPTLPFTSVEHGVNDPIPQLSSIDNDPTTTDTIIECFYDPGITTGSGTDIAGSDVVPVSILRHTFPQNIHNQPVTPKSTKFNHISSIPTFLGNRAFRRRSTNYHPNMVRYSIDFSASHGNNNLPKLPSIPAYPSYPKLVSEPIIYQPSTANPKNRI